MIFNENSRVKIPAILHLCRLGYKYLSLKHAVVNEDTNIFKNIFIESITRINSDNKNINVETILEEISLELDYEDLGQAFYERLIANSGVKLIDFNDFNNNSFHVVTELTYKNGEEEFRPDITVLINGMPLVFIEVKKPNNPDGILSERNRINLRLKNKYFRKFINISQMLIFSNNMEYDIEDNYMIQGAFYATVASSQAVFNYFREDNEVWHLNLNNILHIINEEQENEVLKDNNLESIKYHPEFVTNKKEDTPTNRILNSLLCKNRLAMLLKYGITYVNNMGVIEKHIMRYPQLFATKAIENALEKGIKKGIIWHTQGSGKTALAFYNVEYLTNYFQRKKIIPKFYFIVDRVDLLEQACGEFTKRGLEVNKIDSRIALIQDFKSQQGVRNLFGKKEITIVNIQKFESDTEILQISDYNVELQRIYFLDEAHRSYKPNGSFLASLLTSDTSAIIIGLTGTPLLDNKSKQIFGEYIHKYYYDASIADGYTLRLIREGIETQYKLQLEDALKKIEVLKGSMNSSAIFSHPNFVKPMLEYIIKDFIDSRIRFSDNTIGGMVICESSAQAKALFATFSDECNGINLIKDKKITARLILHDIDTKDDRKKEIEAFKRGDVDLLFVYNMLLTGFDATRLKKLYMGRIVKDHNLLQALTRVNRPYKDFQYGFVVDFADIRKEFDATNQAYYHELQAELKGELQHYSSLFQSPEEIKNQIDNIKEKLFHFDLQNAEIFSQQINEIEDIKLVLEIKKALELSKNLYNAIRIDKHDDLLAELDFKKLNRLYIETDNRLQLLNLKRSITNADVTNNLLRNAVEEIIFTFHKDSEEELIIADQYKTAFRKARETLNSNIDQESAEFIELYDELKRIFERKKMTEATQEYLKHDINALQQLFYKAREINRKNDLLKAKYANDVKYVRMHKRIMEKCKIDATEISIHESLTTVKGEADIKLLNNNNLLENDAYFKQSIDTIVINKFADSGIKLNFTDANYIHSYLANEYIKEGTNR